MPRFTPAFLAVHQRKNTKSGLRLQKLL